MIFDLLIVSVSVCGSHMFQMERETNCLIMVCEHYTRKRCKLLSVTELKAFKHSRELEQSAKVNSNSNNKKVLHLNSKLVLFAKMSLNQRKRYAMQNETERDEKFVEIEKKKNNNKQTLNMAHTHRYSTVFFHSVVLKFMLWPAHLSGLEYWIWKILRKGFAFTGTSHSVGIEMKKKKRTHTP